jgi:hypothetical protein
MYGPEYHHSGLLITGISSLAKAAYGSKTIRTKAQPIARAVNFDCFDMINLRS